MGLAGRREASQALSSRVTNVLHREAPAFGTEAPPRNTGLLFMARMAAGSVSPQLGQIINLVCQGSRLP